METIHRIIGAIHEGTGITPQPFSSTRIMELPCVTYTCYRQWDNAIVEA